MIYNIILCHNTPETRSFLKQRGFDVCPCSSFFDSLWLRSTIFADSDFYKFNKSIHGIGYPCENFCKNYNPVKCCNCSLILEQDENYCNIICTDVLEFVTTHNYYLNILKRNI